ncbi:MAG: bifunctional diaminohydroxyphosphoribosylaminopyrimidine deaminase/5-amino-6-(5-phosphoribosylamino)uracil reductase RibD [Candidatus Micrarchaeota archaeon]
MAKHLSDEKFMRLALQLALNGRGSTKTNPLVGCVIVKNGKIIGKGFHKKFGGPHAEVFALKGAGKSAKGATLYCNLEPCLFYEGKKTPACADLLIKSGISRIVIATTDPNPHISGKSISLLKKNGIRVTTGILQKDALSLNLPYFKFITTGKPYVFLKVAMSLDGRITHPSKKYFSSKPSLIFAHQLRSQSDAILVGIGTVLKDDPSLTTRFVSGKNPLRIILDDKLQIPPNSKVLKDKNVLVVYGKKNHDANKLRLLEKSGYPVLSLNGKNGLLNLNSLLLELGKRNIGTLMIEGGSKVISSFFSARLFDKCYFVIVPEIFGEGPRLLPDSRSEPKLKISSISKSGADYLVEVTPVYG